MLGIYAAFYAPRLSEESRSYGAPNAAFGPYPLRQIQSRPRETTAAAALASKPDTPHEGQMSSGGIGGRWKNYVYINHNYAAQASGEAESAPVRSLSSPNLAASPAACLQISYR